MLILFIALQFDQIERQEIRGNIEGDGDYDENSIDPMKIQILWRDRYPKLGLDKKHVGDQYMMCADMPSKAFLRKGAKYRLLGNNQVSQIQHPQRDGEGNVLTNVLKASSELYGQLCQFNGYECQFRSIVHLDQNIDCGSQDDGLCSMDIVHIVQVSDVYYEYERPACINFPFFGEGKKVLKRLDDGETSDSGCADKNHNTNTPYFAGHLIFTEDTCNTVVVVDTDGSIAVERENTDLYDSLTYFRVNWENDEFPQESNNKCGDFCDVVQGRCRCNVSIENLIKFSSSPTPHEVLSQLSIGAVSADMMDYVSMVTPQEGIKVYFKSKEGVYDIDTAFEVTDEFGRKRLLKNMISQVVLRRSNGNLLDSFKFRNPPVFYNAIPELR